MKYMQTGGFQKNPLMRLTLYLTLAFVCGLWVSNAAMYLTRMGLTPASVESYYLGSEEEFRSAKSAASLLEVTHAHLPTMGVIVLILTHLLIFAPYQDRTKVAVILTAFASAFLGEAAGWGVRFAHPAFAWLKIASFLAFQGVLLFLIISLGMFLRHGSRPPRKRAL